MLDRIDVSEGIDANKTIESKECDNFQFFLKNKEFKLQSYICNRCHDLLMMSMNLSDIAILTIKGADYHCIISGLAKVKP